MVDVNGSSRGLTGSAIEAFVCKNGGKPRASEEL
jgi:hypothetical protein